MGYSLTMPYDAATTAVTLRALTQRGESDVFEVRILATPQGTVSGYFDDGDKAAAAVAAYAGRHNIYFTLNPVNPALLARANNRLAQYAKLTTSDADIVRRRWLLIDCDPVRPSGISATDTEKVAALARAAEVRGFLMSALGWPEPVFADSGNGGHLLWRIDLANDSAARALVEACLKAVSLRFSDGIVAIDESVSNAARICKLYGTASCKGDSTADRPHRPSALLELPSPVSFVAEAQLQSLAQTLPSAPIVDSQRQPGTRPLSRPLAPGAARAQVDVADRLASWGIAVARRKTWQGGFVYILDACPFNADHSGSSAAVIELATGPLLFNCLHDSCRGRTWPQLRALFEPEYAARENSYADSAPDGDGALAPDSAATSGAPAWEPPVPFSTYALPEFPVEALPASVGDYVREVAASTQVAVDLPAMLALSVIAAAAARFAEVRIGETHTEPLNLYTVTALGPGNRKSAVIDIAAPVEDAERRLCEAARPEIALAESRRAIQDKRLSHLREKAAKAVDPADAQDAEHAIERLLEEVVEVPAYPRLLFDDATQETVATMLAQQGGCMALFSAEGGLFDILAGRYSGSGSSKLNLDIYLKGHAAESVRVDRKSRASEKIPRAMITLGLAVQPDVLNALADTPGFRGRGLLGRFLYALPTSLVGRRPYRNRGRSDIAKRAYHDALDALLMCEPPCGVNGKQREFGARHSLRISGDALDAWAEYADAVEARQLEGFDLAEVQDWASKLAGSVARIAGGFHLIEHHKEREPWRTPVSAESVLAAWSVGEYLIPHALAAFAQMGVDPRQSLAQRLLVWIVRSGASRFSFRDCHQAYKARTRDDVERALMLLVDHGFIRHTRDERANGSGAYRGRPKSATYDVYPGAQNPQNPQK